LIRQEQGADVVESLILECAVNAVNLTEVFTKAIKKGLPAQEVRGIVAELRLPVLPVTQAEADVSTELAPFAWKHGLSLGDRLCLASCLTHDLVAVTAERRWPENTGVSIKTIR